jgi:DNA repair protein RadA/Sms
MGKCPDCGAWNSMVEEIVDRGKGRSSRSGGRLTRGAKPQRLSEIEGGGDDRLPLAIEEFSRVLGGGIVPGSIVLVGGDPGIGKSTLLLQMAMSMAADGQVLYVSGEESERQIKTRALRLNDQGLLPDDLYLLTETNLDLILNHIHNMNLRMVVIDSIQTVHTDDIESSPGSVSQVRECASRLQTIAKTSGTAIFLVGHVTKEGAIAGPRVLEHIVDSVLYLEGDHYHAYRLLRSVKNRFGATSEVGVFEMRQRGMIEIRNPSEAFLAERAVNEPGSAIAVTMEGTRPLLVEVQGLTSPTTFGNPRRTANGVDFNRLLLIAAVLTRRGGLKLGDQDVFVNVVGGLRIGEPAADLAMAAAIASSRRDKIIPADLALIGEIGLSGELRAVGQMEARVREAAKLGFSRVIVPKKVRKEGNWPKDIEVISIRSLSDALKTAMAA